MTRVASTTTALGTSAISETAEPRRAGSASEAATSTASGESSDTATTNGLRGSGGYLVSTPVFDGPFDLLLHLILSNEVDLWDVKLADIVDAYVAELEAMEQLDLDVATEFLLIAATLVDLKARRLLPGSERSELDEELRYEERDLLLARLLDCKTFKDAAGALDEQMRLGRQSWPRRCEVEEPFASLAPDPLERVTPMDLAYAAREVFARKMPVEVDTDHIAPIRMSVRDAIETVMGLLPESDWMSFRDLARGSDHRLEIVVRFLAVLELFKQGTVDLAQAETFGDLTVRVVADTVDIDLAAMEWDDEARQDNAEPVPTADRIAVAPSTSSAPGERSGD